MFECRGLAGRYVVIMAGDATDDMGALGGFDCGDLLIGARGVRVGVVVAVRTLYIMLVHVH